MRALTSCLVFALCSPVFAIDPPTKADRERKVKVALALSATKAITADDPNCGQCREDFATAWDDALKSKKPLAVFVGGPCDGLGRAACEAGAVAVKVPSYAQPGKVADEKRIVIGKPNAAGDGFEPVSTLPPKSPAGKVAEAVKAATPDDAKPTHLPQAPAGKRLDWLIK